MQLLQENFTSYSYGTVYWSTTTSLVEVDIQKGLNIPTTRQKLQGEDEGSSTKVELKLLQSLQRGRSSLK